MTIQPTIPQRGTKEFTVYAANMMLDYAQGAVVELLNINSANGLFSEVVGQPAWNWAQYDYRIKPKPTVIPWTISNCPVGKVVTHSATGYRSVIVASGLYEAELGQSGEQSYSNLLLYFTMDNGEPCGTVQQ